MDNVRRAYIYLVSLISLQVVAWALIWLVRDLLPPGRSTSIEDTALQIALIVIGLPIYLVHWLWAQRLAKRDPEESSSVLRCLYLYAVLAIAVAAFALNTADLLDQLLRVWTSPFGPSVGRTLSQHVVFHLAPMVIMALVFAVHYRIQAAGRRSAPETAGALTIRRLYLYGFGLAGLAATTVAVIALLDRLLYWMAGQPAAGDTVLSWELSTLVAGAGLWLAFWLTAQRQARGSASPERISVIRSLYLNLAVFVSVLGVVAAATSILASGLRALMSIPGQGGQWDIITAVSIILPLALVWAYHAYVLRQDARSLPDRPAQAWVPRLYRYLVASVGLGAVLIGLGGVLSSLIRFLAAPSAGLPEELAGFAAILIAGLPVWSIPWRRVQRAAADPGPEGLGERRSLIRRIYLYFYLFAATMTVLGSGVYIVSRLIAVLLGSGGGDRLLTDLAQAIAYSLIAVAVWLYHGAIVRQDGIRARDDQAQRLSALQATIVAGQAADLGRCLAADLARALPGIDLQLIPGAPDQADSGPAAAQGPAPVAVDRLATSDVIIGPWTMAASGGPVWAEVTASPARKLLIPVPAPGWDWLGVDEYDIKDISRQAVEVIKQVAAGDEVTGARRLSAGAIVGIIAGALLILLGFFLPVIFLLEGGLV